jgi:four helix bundle protein
MTGASVGRRLAPQLIAAASSGHATLEEAQSAESDADFISKLCIALKEFRESHARLKVLRMQRLGPTDEVTRLCNEADQIVAIVVTIIKNKRINCGIDVTARRKRPRQRGQNGG